MKLNNKGLENTSAWEAAGYALPQYDREAVAARTQTESILDSFRGRQHFPCLSGKCGTGSFKRGRFLTAVLSLPKATIMKLSRK